MTLIRVKAIGTGATGDPVRADMPSYGLAGIDPVTMLATIDVPDADMPPNMPQAGDPSRPNTPYGPVLIGVPGASMTGWVNTLRQRYPSKGPNWIPPAVQ